MDRFIVAQYSCGPIVSPPTLSKDGNLCWEHRSNEKCWRTSENIRNTVSLKIFSSFSQFLLVVLLCHRLPKTTSFARGEWKQPWILEDLNLCQEKSSDLSKLWEESSSDFSKKKTSTWTTFPSSRNLSGRKFSGSPQCGTFRCKP